MKIKLTCKQCGEAIYKYQSQIDAGEGKFCSRKCYHESMKGVDLFADGGRGVKQRIRVDINCSHCGKLFEIVPSRLGMRKYCSKACYLEATKAVLTNIKQLRESSTYKEWRLFVYNRDGFKCQSCGTIGKNLNAHHIVPVAVDPTRIFDENNGITLCVECHKLAHKTYRPLSKGGELLGTLLLETISSQAHVGTQEKVQRLEDESRTDSNSSTSAVHESDDIV